MQKKVSVIMGIFNCEDTIEDSLNSILNQTYTNWELIMCDDGSSDNTYTLAKKYSDDHSNIILLKNDSNKGLAYSLNKCLKVASGQYIARADADDICLPHRFKTQVNFLDNNDEYQMVGSSAILYDETGRKAIRKTIEKPTKHDLVTSVPFIHPTIMMRKHAYLKLGGYTVAERTRRGQDVDLWFKFYAHGYKAFNIQEPLCKYHESIKDYKKRSFKVRWNGVKTRYIGYKSLGFPKIYYISLLKPLIAGLVPRRIMYFYHKSIKGRSLKKSG